MKTMRKGSWRLADEMDHLEHELDAFFETFSLRGNDLFRVSTKKWRPPCDVLETKKSFILRMEIAGMKTKDFSVAYTAGRLTISGQREHWPQQEDAHYRQLELNSGYFERTIRLPLPVESDKIKACYRDGILEVILPKAKDKERPRRVIKIDL